LINGTILPPPVFIQHLIILRHSLTSSNLGELVFNYFHFAKICPISGSPDRFCHTLRIHPLHVTRNLVFADAFLSLRSPLSDVRGHQPKPKSPAKGRFPFSFRWSFSSFSSLRPRPDPSLSLPNKSQILLLLKFDLPKDLFPSLACQLCRVAARTPPSLSCRRPQTGTTHFFPEMGSARPPFPSAFS